MAVVGTPTTLSGMNAIALRKVAHDSKLRVDSVRPSVLTQVPTEFKINDMGQVVITKPGFFLDVTNVGRAQQGQSVRVALRVPLRKRARYGTGETILNNEDESDLNWTELYYNEIKKGVKFNTWGYDYNDTEYLNYNSGYPQLLALFNVENDDTRMQKALLLTYAPELTYAPLNNTLTQAFNKNWIIPNMAEASYPTYDTTAETITDGAIDADPADLYYASRTYGGAGNAFSENLGDALLAASGTGASPNAILNVDHLSQVNHYNIHNHVVEPIMLDGIPSYLFKIATPVKSWMLNPNNTGSMAAHMLSVSDYKDPKRATLIGEIGRLFDDLVVVHDTRSPTLVVGGTADARTLQPGFLEPGNNDDRNNNAWSNTSGATNYVFDINSIIGQNGLARYTRDGLISGLSETTEYGKIKGSATYKGEGIQIPAFDKDASARSATTQIQRGSAIVPVSRRTIDTVA